MNRAIFWDLQGTLGGNAVSNVLDFTPYPFAKEALTRAKTLGFYNIIISNQSGIAKGIITLSDFEEKRSERRQGTVLCPDCKRKITVILSGMERSEMKSKDLPG